MEKEQAAQILKNVIDNLRLTRQEYEQLLEAIKVLLNNKEKQ